MTGSQLVSAVSVITFSAIELTVARLRFRVSTWQRILDTFFPGGGGKSVTVGNEEM
jgi:hypothetical protein